MLKKIYFLIIISLLFQGCDYKPIYSKNNPSTFKITDLEFTGDKDINNYFEKNLMRLSDTNAKKNYKIFVNTVYSKGSLTKNKSGNTTDYKINLSVYLKVTQIKNNNVNFKEEEISFSENFIISKNNSTFEQTNYEGVMKNNLSEILLNKIIMFLKTK
tara:strand:+ start:64 stop:537 length:474 start_codon:yes stop_codon:yes gene_type:complete